MNSDIRRDLQRQLQQSAQRAVNYRQGVVTNPAPLTVTLGGSSLAYTGVRSVAGPLSSGDVISALLFGNDLLVLGRITDVPETAHVVGAGSEPAFANSWVNVGAGNESAAFYKDRGRVFLGGRVKSGTVGAAIFTLPAGFRPAGSELVFPVIANGAAGELRVQAGGAVYLRVGSNADVDLTPVSFRAA